MKKITIILILIFSFSCTDVNKLVEDIAKDEIMESEYIGLVGTKSKQYQNFQKLKSKASNEELRNLITHENPILRTYAYQSLIERDLMKPSEAFKDALQNNESFSKMIADQILGTDICKEIYFEIINYYPNAVKQIKQIDSLILYNLDENHFLQYMALKDKSHEEKYNDRIINLALEHHNSSAIFYIVENDIEIDKSKFKESIRTAIKKGGIGTEPMKELKNIFVNLDDGNKKKTDANK